MGNASCCTCSQPAQPEYDWVKRPEKIMSKIQNGAVATELFSCITTADQLADLKKRIPTGARVAVDTEGSPSPFCVFVSFLDANHTLVYGSVAIRHLEELSVLDLKFQAGVGWNFRPACGNEVGIHYEFVDPDKTVRQVSFEDGAAAEKGGATMITIARMASASQMRALASGEVVSFTTGRNTISVVQDKADVLYGAEILADQVAKTNEIWHLVGDALPAYQNATLEQVLTRRCVPVKVDQADLRDECFYVLELADATGKKTDYVPVHPGCRFQEITAKPLVRIVSEKGAGSTIDLPPTDLDLDGVQAFMRSLAKEKQVTFAAHNKTKEEKDLDIKVVDDSHNLVTYLKPFLDAANLKAVGSSAIFHLFRSILKMISSPPIFICNDEDLVTCTDIHSLPVEVCVLTLLFALLRELSDEEIRDALRSSVLLGEEQKAKVEAALSAVALKGEEQKTKVEAALPVLLSTGSVQSIHRGIAKPDSTEPFMSR